MIIPTSHPPIRRHRFSSLYQLAMLCFALVAMLFAVGCTSNEVKLSNNTEYIELRFPVGGATRGSESSSVTAVDYEHNPYINSNALSYAGDDRINNLALIITDTRENVLRILYLPESMVQMQGKSPHEIVLRLKKDVFPTIPGEYNFYAFSYVDFNYSLARNFIKYPSSGLGLINGDNGVDKVSELTSGAYNPLFVPGLENNTILGAGTIVLSDNYLSTNSNIPTNMATLVNEERAVMRSSIYNPAMFHKWALNDKFRTQRYANHPYLKSPMKDFLAKKEFTSGGRQFDFNTKRILLLGQSGHVAIKHITKVSQVVNVPLYNAEARIDLYFYRKPGVNFDANVWEDPYTSLSVELVNTPYFGPIDFLRPLINGKLDPRDLQIITNIDRRSWVGNFNLLRGDLLDNISDEPFAEVKQFHMGKYKTDDGIITRLQTAYDATNNRKENLYLLRDGFAKPLGDVLFEGSKQGNGNALETYDPRRHNFELLKPIDADVITYSLPYYAGSWNLPELYPKIKVILNYPEKGRGGYLYNSDGSIRMKHAYARFMLTPQTKSSSYGNPNDILPNHVYRLICVIDDMNNDEIEMTINWEVAPWNSRTIDVPAFQ